VRAAAEVEEFAGAVNRNPFIGPRELLDEVALHEVAFLFKLLQALVAGQEFTRIRNVLLHQLLHLGFDFLQIFGGEWSRTVEVVEKSALGSRTVPQLGFGKELQHGSGQQVRRGMPIYLE